MNHNLQTCRFCSESSYDGNGSMVKYGVRHYAHYGCYLEAGKKIEDLHTWQIKLFPMRVLKQFGLLEAAERLTEKDPA